MHRVSGSGGSGFRAEGPELTLVCKHVGSYISSKV